MCCLARYDQDSKDGGRDGLLKLRNIVVLTLIVAGTMAMESSATASDAKDAPDGDPKGSATEIRTEEMVPTGLSWEEFLHESNRQLTPEEFDRIAAEVKQNSSPAHYFPNAPDDTRMEPPALDAAGREKP
jgi:hypothetical protein